MSEQAYFLIDTRQGKLQKVHRQECKEELDRMIAFRLGAGYRVYQYWISNIYISVWGRLPELDDKSVLRRITYGES